MMLSYIFPGDGMLFEHKWSIKNQEVQSLDLLVYGCTILAPIRHPRLAVVKRLFVSQNVGESIHHLRK